MIKKIKLKVLILIIILIPANQILWNYLFKINFFEAVTLGTNYLIQPTLISNVIAILIFSILIFHLGELRFKDLLLDRRKVKKGIIWTLILWGVTSLFSIFYLLFKSSGFELTKNMNVVIGGFIGQIFGNAALEEELYRGLFFLQFYLIFGQKFNNKLAIIFAVFTSQILFALVHIPNRIIITQTANLLPELIKLFLIGVILTLIFLRTKNLFFMIGAHALINVPISIIQIDFPLPIVVLITFVLIAIFWNYIEKDRYIFWTKEKALIKKAQNANNV